MTDKPEQRSVALAHNLLGYMNVQIDELLRTMEDRAGQLEQAFMAELAHLDELFTDADPEDVSQDNLLQVEGFDKGYARTMACIQAATERLVEARAHIARITNTIETHQAFTGNGAPPGKTVGLHISGPGEDWAVEHNHLNDKGLR